MDKPPGRYALLKKAYEAQGVITDFYGYLKTKWYSKFAVSGTVEYFEDGCVGGRLMLWVVCDVLV